MRRNSASKISLSAILAFGLTISTVIEPASAHLTLTSPARRADSEAGLKTAPCGSASLDASGPVSTYQPGETITVTWDETVSHPSHYRIAFAKDPSTIPDPLSFTDFELSHPSLLAYIDDQDGNDTKGATDKGPQSYQLTLPNEECDNCTLQVIQVMTDKGPIYGDNDIYYQCAQLSLVANAVSVSSSDAGSSPTASGTGGTTTSGAAGSSTTGSSGSAGSGNVDTGSAGTGDTGVGGASSSGAGDGGCNYAPSGEKSPSAPLAIFLGTILIFCLRAARKTERTLNRSRSSVTQSNSI